MCGCNSNVTFTKDANPNPNQMQYSVPAPRRQLGMSCDTFGNCGVIEKNDFVTSCGTAISMVRNRTNKTGFPPNGGFSASLSSSLITSIGLRQLAEEFATMADQLDGLKTVVSMAGSSNVVVKKRKKSKKAKKATKKN